MADVTVKLPYSAPYDWMSLIAFLSTRAIPGVESITIDAYRRVIAVHDMYGIVDVRPVAGASHLLARIQLPKITALGPVVHRLRRLFDTGADPAAISALLAADPRLAPLVARWPGVRVPGAWDGFELAIRAILGQQITVRGATQLAARLVSRYGAPFESGDDALITRFPEPTVLAALDPAQLATDVGMPRARAATIVELARATAADPTLLHTSASLDSAIARLTALPGIGPWTAHYIAMRAVREPDAFPASDLVIRQQLSDDGATPARESAVLRRAEAWRPWRAYATMYLWMSSAEPATQEER